MLRRLSRILSRVGSRRVLLALGALYIASAVSYPSLPFFEDVAIETGLLVAVLVGVPGLVLLYTGYRLPRGDVRPEFHATIASWCLAGIGVILAVLGLIEVATSLRDPVQNILILTALASVAGLGVGRYHARAQTRRRDLEERNQELERTKAELEATVTELRTANERLEQFTYAASHDLQEPLRMVSSYLQLLERRHGDDLDEEAVEFLEFAVGGADRMRAMVESLLEYSRISTRGEPLEPADAAPVLDAVLDDLEGRIEETDATVTVDDLPTVKADPDQLAMVFEHLLSNALTFSGDEPPQVHVSAARVDDAWRFSVADEGVGIDPEYHDRIFTVFENLNASEEPLETGGGGVGLALCERIVERHDGDIWVESNTSDGATFHFTVPAAVNHQTDAPASPRSPRQSDERLASDENAGINQ